MAQLLLLQSAIICGRWSETVFLWLQEEEKKLAGKNFAAGGHFCNISCHMAYTILTTTCPNIGLTWDKLITIKAFLVSCFSTIECPIAWKINN